MFRHCIPLFALLSSILIQAQAAAAQASDKLEAQVAVLHQTGFPYMGGFQALPPSKIVEQVRKGGLTAALLTVDQMCEAGTLTPEHYPIVVLPYGNTYPEAAFEALRAYQSAGGTLVLCGVPFTHPTVLKGEKWKDLGHKPHFDHSSEGIGSGGFAGPFDGVLRVATPGFLPNPLGLRSEDIPSGTPTLQVLDVSTLPQQDEVIPIIELIDNKSKKAFPVSAIIHHRCPEFNGSTTVWLGTVAAGSDASDAHMATQLLLRSIAWVLREKQQITSAEAQKVFAVATSLAKPTPLPNNLKFHLTPRPWGDTYLPKSVAPARHLTVVDISALNQSQRVALACLQALSSRKQPKLYLQIDSASQFFLDWHKEKGYIDGYEVAEDWKTPFNDLKDCYKGAVIPDPNLYEGETLALNVAANEDLIVLTPEMARELAIPVKLDMRGRFATYSDGLKWVIDKYKTKLSRHLAHFLAPGRVDYPSYTYAMQFHGLLLWPSGPAEADKPGVDALREKVLVANWFAHMAPGGVVLGFPYAGDGVGLGEGAGVELTSSYGLGHIASDYVPNLCVFSGVQIKTLTQAPQAPAPKLERDKIYVALNMSDGDNMSVWTSWKEHYFSGPRFGEFPLAFGIAPSMLDVMPGVMQWYFERGSSTTEFFPDVSGIAYTQPDNFGKAFTPADRVKVWAQFLDFTKRYMAELDMKTLRTVGGTDDNLMRYSRVLPIHSVLADMGRYSGREGIANLTYTLPGAGVGGKDLPVFRSVTSWRFGKPGFLQEVRDQVGTQRPAFVNGFVHAWTWGNLDAVAEIYDKRDADMVFVTPAQLAELYAEAKQEGMTK